MNNGDMRILKNSLYLYIRMFVIMALSFITTRIVLDKLGAVDYGINNLVAGFVSMFVVLNNILSTSTNRFLALALGKGNVSELKRTFSTAFVVHFVIAVLLVIILEIVGFWFLNNKLNIEPNRIMAARWVFHISVFNVFWQVTQTPYTACVTAHEKFNMYALMSIYDVVMKIMVLYLLVVIPFDKLIIYTILQMVVSFTSLWIYRIYCLEKFEECSFSFQFDKNLAKEMMNFSAWGVFGHVITIINSQGFNIILNIFYNTVMNAARGLANTVNFTISQFVGGFLTAAQPQLVKYYGAGDMKNFQQLIFNVSQYTLFLVALIGVPAILEVDYVIKLWLGDNVPYYTVPFVQISLFCSVINRSNSMIDNGIVASGHMKELNLYSTPVYLITLPIFYSSLKIGLGPIVATWVSYIAPFFAFILNLYILNKKVNFPSRTYFFKVFVKNVVIIIASCTIPFIIRQNMSDGIARFLVVCSISVLCTVSFMWLFALNQDVKMMVYAKVKNTFHF